VRPGPLLREHRAALWVGAVAGAVRLVWVLLAAREPRGLSDPQIYLMAARSIGEGSGYSSMLGEPTAYYPPGYPYFLGALHWVVDPLGASEHVVLVIGVVQALLGAVAAGALVVAGRHLMPRGPVDQVGDPTGARRARTVVGVTAGLLFAFWPNLVVHSGLVLSESVFLAGFCVLLAALLTWIDRAERGAGLRGSGRWLIAAIVVGTAWCTLVRPQSVALLIPAVGLSLVAHRMPARQVLSTVGLLAAGTLLALVPWTVRNSVVMDAFVPMSTNTGDNLCIGFHDGANGAFRLTEDCATEQAYTAGPAVEVARDAELRDRALEWIGDNLDRVPGLGLSKLRVTFQHDYDGLSAWESYGADLHLHEHTRNALRWVFDLYYWAVAALALGGAALVVTGRRAAARGPGEHGAARVTSVHRWAVLLVTVSGALIPAAFFGEPRFKVPITPGLALLAAMVVGQLLRSRLRTGAPSGAEDLSDEDVSPSGSRVAPRGTS
jgi:hypothetical protein